MTSQDAYTLMANERARIPLYIDRSKLKIKENSKTLQDVAKSNLNELIVSEEKVKEIKEKASTKASTPALNPLPADDKDMYRDESKNEKEKENEKKKETEKDNKNQNTLKYYCKVVVDPKGKVGECVASTTGLKPLIFSDATRVVERVLGPYATLSDCNSICASKTKVRNENNNSDKDEQDQKKENDFWKTVGQALFWVLIGLFLFSLGKSIIDSWTGNDINKLLDEQMKLYNNNTTNTLLSASGGNMAKVNI